MHHFSYLHIHKY